MTIRLADENLKKLSELSREWGFDEDSLLEEALYDWGRKYTGKRKSLFGRTAFVVDDSPTMRMMLLESLSRAGIIVAAQAADGFDAVRLFNGNERYDFVFLNVTMPEMDGIEALSDFKKDRDSRIIMVTTTRLPALLLESVRNGAHCVLYRPFTYKDLISAMTDDDVFHEDMGISIKSQIELIGFKEDSELSQRDVFRLAAFCNQLSELK